MRRRSLLQALCLPAIGLPGRARAAGLREITIPIASTSFGTSGLRVANELGLYERQGLSARIVVMDSGNAALAALLGGSADASEGASGDLIAARARGQDVVTIADLYRGFTATLALANTVVEKRGVAAGAPLAERLKALDDVVIASPSATSIYTLGLRKAAEGVGAHIRFTYMAQPAMVAALDAGAIQGMIAGAPFWATPVLRGKAQAWISGPRGEFPPADAPVSAALLITTGRTAREDRDLVQKLRKVISDLGEAIATRPDEVRAAEARVYPDLDPQALKLMLDAEMGNLRTRPFTVADMRHEIEFVRSSGASLPGIDQLDAASLLPGY